MVISSLVDFLVVWLVPLVGRSVGHGFLDLGLLVKFQQWIRPRGCLGHVCQDLNSHYFHIVGDGHQPNNRTLYAHYKDSLLKVPIYQQLNIREL